MSQQNGHRRGTPSDDVVWGRALQEISEVRHDYRGLRHAVNLLTEKAEQDRIQLVRIQTRLTTSVSIASALFGIIGLALRYFSN